MSTNGRFVSRSSSSLCWGLAALVGGISSGASVSLQAGDSPRVMFDTAAVVACQDVTNEEFSSLHPGERLMEAIVEVSSLHRDVGAQAVEYLIQIYSPGRTVYVVNYAPQTTVDSSIAGNISVETTREGNASIGLDANGSFEHLAHASGHAAVGGSTLRTERFEEIPAAQLVLASGLMHRGSGVYYKVRSSTFSVAEGSRQLTLRFRVSEDWRGDILHVACAAFKHQGAEYDGETSNIGGARFAVAVHRVGDREAQLAAREYANCEFRLRQCAKRCAEDIEESSYPSVLDRLGRAINVARPRIPENWLNELVFGDDPHAQGFATSLPEDLHQAIARFQAARLRLLELSESGDALETIHLSDNAS